jgi:curved DNA-binding protein CbpA
LSSHYQTLGIGLSATAEDIRKAFRALAKQYHPDGSAGDEQLFRKIHEAYHILSTPALKQRYDQELFYSNAYQQLKQKAQLNTNTFLSELLNEIYRVKDNGPIKLDLLFEYIRYLARHVDLQKTQLEERAYLLLAIYAFLEYEQLKYSAVIDVQMLVKDYDIFKEQKQKLLQTKKRAYLIRKARPYMVLAMAFLICAIIYALVQANLNS